MKILVFVQHLAAAGALRQLGTLAPELEARGHTVSLVGLHEVDEEWRLLWNGDAEALLAGPKGSFLELLGATRRLRRRVKAEQPDVLYAYHGDVARFVGWLATRGSRTTLVWGVQGGGRMRRSLAAGLCRRVSRSVPLLITSSDAARARYGAGGFRCRRAVTVKTGVDTDRFRPDPQARVRVRAEWGIGDDETLIGVVARVDPASRRHAIFLDALSRLDGNLRYVFVGAGSPLGFRGDMPAVYNGLDALCSPSLWEGFPNAVAEAMACGVPCVVTDTGDSAEVVADSGVVVPPGDPARLAEGIRELLARDVRAGDVRELITSRFSVAAYVQATEAALGAMAGSSLQASSPEAAARPEASGPHARSRP